MIEHYHWFWYLLGFMFVPRLTFMILVTIYFREIIPTWLFVIGWIVMFADFTKSD